MTTHVGYGTVRDQRKGEIIGDVGQTSNGVGNCNNSDGINANEVSDGEIGKLVMILVMEKLVVELVVNLAVMIMIHALIMMTLMIFILRLTKNLRKSNTNGFQINLKMITNKNYIPVVLDLQNYKLF